MTEHVFLYGAGKIGRQTASMAHMAGTILLAWLDADASRAGEELCGARIYGIDDFPEDGISRIVIAVSRGYGSIRQTLMERGIAAERIVSYGAFWLEASRAMAAQLPAKQNVLSEQDADIYISLPLGFVLGGVEAFSLVLYDRLQAMGKRVKFLCFANEAGTPERVCQNVVLLPGGTTFAARVGQAMTFLRRHPGRTIIMNWLEEVSLAAAALQETCHFRMLSILHSDFEDIYRNNACLASMVQAYVGVSEMACRHLMEAGVEAGRIHSVTLPLDGADTLVRSYAQAGAPLRLGYAGRIVQRPKRIDLQLELIRRLEAAGIPYEYHFMGCGTYEAEVRAFIEREGVGDHVFLHPPCPRTKIGAFWQYMDVCISTSLWEGRGISILEAMMWGAVPVVTETAGAHQDIEDGRDGYIVPIGDVDAMTGRVLELAQHRGRLPVMGRNAHERVQKYGDFEAFDALWKELCDGKKEI